MPIEINCSHPQSQSQPRYQFAAAQTITSRRHYHHNFSPLLHLASDPTKEETESQSQRHDDEHEHSGDGVNISSNADLLSHKVVLENEMNKTTSTNGELECYFGLKCQFDHGDDPEKGSDMTRAIDWYTKAAKQGNLFAMAILQYCYMRGLGVEKDLRIALDFMNELSEQSMHREQNQNGDGGSGEFEKSDLAFQFLERQMVATGTSGRRPVDPMLHYLMGVCYYGGFGVEACETTAVEWFRLAAEQGDVVTQSLLGVFYYRGIVVEQNEAESSKWFQLAAEHGDVLAFLGACYHSGIGIEQSDEEAVKWYRLAADRGHEYAQKILDSCFVEAN